TIPCVPELVPVTRLVTLTRVTVGNTAWCRENQTPCWARRSKCGVVSGVIMSARRPSKPTITTCVGCIALPSILHRLDAQTLHETVFDVSGTLGRTPCRPLCVNNSDDNPWARLPQGTGKSALKRLLSLNGLDLLKTGALRKLGQVRAKGGMRRL